MESPNPNPNPNKIEYKGLSLGPGAMKGFLHLGALFYLHHNMQLIKLEKVVGCSIGSIILLLYILGYSPTEIILHTIDLKLFDDLSFLQYQIVMHNLKQNNGVIEHSKLCELIEPLILAKINYIPTLEQLYQITKIDYYVVTSNLTLMTSDEISRHNNPNMSILDAIIMSCNIPFVFQDKEYECCYYLDGYLGNPHPIDIIDDKINHVLGIYINDQSMKNHLKFRSKVDYLKAIIMFPFEQLRRRIEHSSSNMCTHLALKYSCQDENPIALELKRSDKLKLIYDGFHQTQEFFRLNLDGNRKVLFNEENEEIEILG